MTTGLAAMGGAYGMTAAVVAGAVGGVESENALLQYARTTQATYESMRSNDVAREIEKARRFRNVNPIDSVQASLGTIDGLSPTERSQLLKAVIQRAVPISKSQDMPASDAMDYVITKTKFEDPGLEKVRQTAAKDWTVRHPQVRRGLEGLLDAAASYNPLDWGPTAKEY